MLISEHEPRKGTETGCEEPIVQGRLLLHFRTRTPKGDGNSCHPLRLVRTFGEFQNTNPERGRKPRDLAAIKDGDPRISEHEPRKGTETCWPHSTSRSPLRSISEHEPRKGTETSDSFLVSFKIYTKFQNTNPERGRKLLAAFLYMLACTDYFRTRTPKGDGNQSCT